jgi:hypothetical protein
MNPVRTRLVVVCFQSVDGWRKWFRVVLAACALLASAACHREAGRSLSFVQSLRCGMTRAEVRWLSHARGYNSSDQSWLTRSATNESMKSKELSFVDLTFRGDRLVALREGKYDPHTKRVEYRNVDLCNAAPRFATGPMQSSRWPRREVSLQPLRQTVETGEEHALGDVGLIELVAHFPLQARRNDDALVRGVARLEQILER